MTDRIKRLENCGFNPIHLFNNLYFVRCYSRLNRKFSLYKFMIIK